MRETQARVFILLAMLALFIFIAGILELLFHGLLLSSWYCVLIAGFAFCILYSKSFEVINGELAVRLLAFSIYLFILSVLFRISPGILFGGVANIIIFIGITLFVVAACFFTWN